MSLYLHSVHKTIITIAIQKLNVMHKEIVWPLNFFDVLISVSFAKTSRDIGTISNFYALSRILHKKVKFLEIILLYSEKV